MGRASSNARHGAALFRFVIVEVLDRPARLSSGRRCSPHYYLDVIPRTSAARSPEPLSQRPVLMGSGPRLRRSRNDDGGRYAVRRPPLFSTPLSWMSFRGRAQRGARNPYSRGRCSWVPGLACGDPGM